MGEIVDVEAIKKQLRGLDRVPERDRNSWFFRYIEDVPKLQRENERLRAALGLSNFDKLALAEKVERLRVALRTIQQWDCLNPPDPRSDLPWLKRLVDEALSND